MSSKLENKFVSKSISKLYLKSDFADVFFAFTIDGETTKVPAHKSILAVASSVFQVMFFGLMKEKDVVKIVDADDSAFKEFLQFFYLPEIKLTMKNIEAVVRLVDKYDMMECLSSCVEFLESRLTNANIIWGYQLAISMNNAKLKKFCEDKIQFLSGEFLKSDVFLQCDREVVKHILQLETSTCSETELFEACFEWAKASCKSNGSDENNPDNLKHELGDLFHLIPFGGMTFEEIGMIIANKLKNGLFTKEELAEIVCIRSVEKFKPKLFQNINKTRMNLKWDDKNVLKCIQGRNTGGNYRIQSKESTWFSTDEPVLLGKIYVASVQNDYSYCYNLMFIMNIIELQGYSLKASSANKVLFTEFAECSSNNDRSITLTRPIFIYPKKIYEIRLEVQNNYDRNLYHSYTWDSEVRLKEGLTVAFHKHSAYNQSGLVQSLEFNRIRK